MTPFLNKKTASKFFYFKSNINSILSNKDWNQENYDSFNNPKRRFSNSHSKLSDIERIWNSVTKHQQEMQKFKRELDERKKKDQDRDQEKSLQLDLEKQKQDELKAMQELANENKTFSQKSDEAFERLMDKHEKAEGRFFDFLVKSFDFLGKEKTVEIHSKYKEPRAKIKENMEKRAHELEGEFNNEIKSVAYYTSKIDIESARFKKHTQLLEKEEQEIDQAIQKAEHKDSERKVKYDAEREQFIEEHKIDVKDCRQEKATIKKDIESNLEKPSEIMESLLEDFGPDYTGGDD